MPSLEPRLVRANEMYHVDARLEMTICRYVLIMSRGSDIVGEAYTVIVVAKMGIYEALVGSIERYSPLGHGHHGIIVAHVRGQNHNARVEQIGPSDVGGSREGVCDVEELVGGSIRDDIGVYVDDLAKLGLAPEVDLGKGRV